MVEIIDLFLPYVLKKERDNIVFIEGSYEYKNVILEKGDVVIDCGANIEKFSSIAASKVETGKVYSFEPVKKFMMYYKTQRNIIVI